MKSPLTLVAIALLMLSACARDAGAPALAGAAAGQTPTAASAGAATSATPAATLTRTVASEAANAANGPNRDESALERIAALPASAELPAGKWVAGTHYRPLVPAQTTDAAPGKIEVVEMFWYGCPHCYAFDPYLESWRKNKAPYIEFRRVPVTWGEVHRAHARLFYALQALGKEEALHSAVFAEMQEKKNFMFTAGNEHDTIAAEVVFAKAHGISEADFMSAYNSFTVQTNLQKADDLQRRYKVEGVPLMVVGGKYVTDVGMAGGEASDLISIVNDLAASAKRR